VKKNSVFLSYFLLEVTGGVMVKIAAYSCAGATLLFFCISYNQ
jgi:hypothetical protein